MARRRSWVSLADFFGFIYKVVTRQKIKSTNSFVFTLVFVFLPLPLASRKEVDGICVWDIVQSAYAQYALVPSNNDAHTFLIFVGKVGSITFTEKAACSVCRGVR